MIPETAPFSVEQRAWLNGFFAGMLSLDAQVTPLKGELPGAAAKALAGGDADDDAPWHDVALPIDERMQLAEGRPLPRKLFAAMAQQDCGQCGYLCETYSAAIADGSETKLNLCVPGGKETSRMLKRLLGETPALPAGTAPATAKAAPPAERHSRPRQVARRSGRSRISLGGATERTGFGEGHPPCRVRHLGLRHRYAPGDSFGLFPSNDPALADAVLAAMRAPPDFPIGDKTFRQALIEDYALGAAPDMLFELIGFLVGGERRRKAKLLAKGGDPDGDAATLDVLAALETFGPIHPDPEAFLECLEPLQPRLYSIASSPLVTPGEIHLTVDAVRYAVGARTRLGAASTFLADRLAPGQRVKVYVQAAHGFGLPADPATPIVMVGPGTGVAPFRSFLLHRRAMQASGKAWLFFGHQRQACDFFYRDEFEAFLPGGTLTRLSTAWSRDGDKKVYVQDRMREAGAELWSWLQQARISMCAAMPSAWPRMSSPRSRPSLPSTAA